MKAIDDLKERRKKGERLEDTQLKKIEAEDSINKELDELELKNQAAQNGGNPVA